MHIYTCIYVSQNPGNWDENSQKARTSLSIWSPAGKLGEGVSLKSSCTSFGVVWLCSPTVGRELRGPGLYPCSRNTECCSETVLCYKTALENQKCKSESPQTEEETEVGLLFHKLVVWHCGYFIKLKDFFGTASVLVTIWGLTGALRTSLPLTRAAWLLSTGKCFSPGPSNLCCQLSYKPSLFRWR